jgi:hypothetical protein
MAGRTDHNVSQGKKPMSTTRKEQIKKLRALARSPNQHEAAQALEKAQAMEAKLGTGKIIAHTIAELLAARGLRVCVLRHRSEHEQPMPQGIDVVVRYRDRRSSFSHAGPLYEIEVSQWEWTGREPDRAKAKNMARAFHEWISRGRERFPSSPSQRY